MTRSQEPETPPSPFRLRDQPLVDQLARRSLSDCVPLLLKLAHVFASRKRPSELLHQYARDAFVAPCLLDQRLANQLDALALEAANGFDAVLLSPLAPLGCCVGVSPSHQDRIVSTLRGTEVVSDPTNVLALECAQRLAKAPATPVRLCTVHQTVRAQRFAAKRAHTQHFRLFALAEAGLRRAEHAFEVEAFVRHAQVFGTLLDACERALGCRYANRVVKLLVANDCRPLGARVLGGLRAAMPALPIEEGTIESAYYAGVRVLFDAETPEGQRVNVADTGLFDWVGKLTSNARFAFVASGLGLQLLPLLWRR